MSRDSRLFLYDIITRCEKVVDLSKGMTLESFIADEVRYEALLRHLTVIGEAVKALPGDVRVRSTDIPWRKIAGLRDLLVHVYFGIKDEIVFEIIQRDVPRLLAACKVLATDQEIH